MNEIVDPRAVRRGLRARTTPIGRIRGYGSRKFLGTVPTLSAVPAPANTAAPVAPALLLLLLLLAVRRASASSFSVRSSVALVALFSEPFSRLCQDPVGVRPAVEDAALMNLPTALAWVAGVGVRIVVGRQVQLGALPALVPGRGRGGIQPCYLLG